MSQQSAANGHLDRWAFETGTLRGVAPQFVPSNDSAAGGQRAF